MSVIDQGPARRILRDAKVVVVFRNDDPSAISNLAREREIFALFERYAVPQTLAVIPCVATTGIRDPHGTGERLLSDNPELVEFLKDYIKRTGSEVALHGYTHRANRFSDPRRREYSEFKSLPLAEQTQMIRAGLDILENVLGTRPLTFVPPWNRWDHNTIAACIKSGCRIISAGPYVTASSGVIAFGANSNLQDFQRDYRDAKRGTRPVFLNVLFHSRTLTDAQQELLIQALEEVSQDDECQPATIAEVVSEFPQELDRVNEAGRNVVLGHEVPRSVRAQSWPYLTALGKVVTLNQLNRLMRAATDLYRGGDYAGVCALTKAINSISTRILLLGRTISLLAGLAIMAVAGWLFQRVWPQASIPIHWIVSIVVFGSGIVASRQTIAADTRKELILSGSLAAMGVLVGQFLIVRLSLSGTP